MLDSPIELVARDPHWRSMLEAYRDAQRAQRQADAERDGWVPRLRTIDGVPAEMTSPVHGRLLAHGLLKFQLAGQGASTGLEYQVTPLGRRALGEAVPLDESGSASEGLAESA